MVLTERIQEYMQKLPTALQMQVLDFVEYLLTQLERQAARQEEKDRAGLSLAGAMRDMEHEETPVYTAADLKVVFS